MTRPRRICVLTGTRADYGLLRQLVREIEFSTRAELQLVVTGTHLSLQHGSTSSEVEADRLKPAATVPIWSGDDSALGAAHDTGLAVAAFASALSELLPDIVVVLGDRLEALAMATAAAVLLIPVAHIHGGEVTAGAMDDSLRHAITKLAYLHFTSTEEHRNRVIQLGEAPDRVFSLGAPIVDALENLELLSLEEVIETFGVRISAPTALVTYHPAGLDVLPSRKLFAELLAALEASPELQLIITGTNSDIGSGDIRADTAEFVAAHADRVDYIESFGQRGYLSAMSYVDVVIGNSSSTVLEAPVLGIPSVLIGDRQTGRPQGATVVHPEPNAADIRAAIVTATSADFRASTRQAVSPFGVPGFARRTLEVLLSHDLPRPPRKYFHTIDPRTPWSKP